MIECKKCLEKFENISQFLYHSCSAEDKDYHIYKENNELARYTEELVKKRQKELL